MSIKAIKADELRRMTDKEGLILQGCGGDLNEWVDGINEMLTEDGILQKKTKFNADNVRTFEHNNSTCLLFPFDDSVKLSMSQLAMWRLKTHEQFYGTWLSDFVPNNLGGFLFDEVQKEKPDCPLIGADGNIYNLMGIASRTLNENGMRAEAKEMINRITDSGS